MRTPWEGAEGIAWLCVADTERLQSGGFYLDRKPQVKHMAGPFFTEGVSRGTSANIHQTGPHSGDSLAHAHAHHRRHHRHHRHHYHGKSHTKNTSAEVDRMMDMLEEWSTAAARPAAPTSDEAMAADLKRPLCAMSRPIDIQAFMGRWYVAGGILTFLEQEKKNCIEDYAFDHDNNRIRVSFKMNNAKGEETELLQRAKIVNETNTQWSLSPKFGVYLPLGIAYLVLDCDTENYSYTVIGVPDRSYVWIMGRAPVMDEATWAACVSRAEKCGYDVSKLTRVEHDRDMEKEGAVAGKGAEEPTAAEALAAEEPAKVAA
mmetsp:Transcript_10421/g.27540  ORF Transcript_10421/g.27540 Transcript_10421/m.27540 type:complete len:317 (-) Transcript_10421:208-1158(-)